MEKEPPTKTETRMEYSPPSLDVGETETATKEKKVGWAQDFIDSFKRNPNSRVTPPSQAVRPDGLPVEPDIEAAAYTPPLATKLKARHLQMIAIGGSIGMSLRSVICHIHMQM